MSGSKRYKDEFDKDAGAPAEFDSLFVFEQGKLHAKKRIKKVPAGKKTAVSLAAAAAIMIAAGAALSAVSQGGITTIGEMSPGGDVNTPVTAAVTAAGTATQPEVLYESEAASLESEAAMLKSEADSSRVQDMFGYSVLWSYPNAFAARSSEAVELADNVYGDVMSASQFIIRGVVRDKSYSEETDETVYEICVMRLISKSDYMPLISEQWDIMSIRCAHGSDIDVKNELQIGREYIIPAIISFEGDLQTTVIADPSCACICKNGENWEMDANVYMSLAALAEERGEVVYRDDNGVMKAEISEENMEKGLESFFVSSGETYISEHSNLSSEPESLFIHEIFKNEIIGSEETRSDAGYYELSADGADKTVCILEYKTPFELAPNINGKVTYAGDNMQGRQMIKVKLTGDEYEGLSVIFAGDMEIACETNDNVYGQVLGRGGSTPIYIRIIGRNGKPAELNYGIAD